jgi:hypothetical protein
METPIHLNCPILSLNPNFAVHCFERYISAIYTLFSYDSLEENLGGFESEVGTIQNELGLSLFDQGYTELEILKDDNAIKVLACIAIYKNSEYIRTSLQKLKANRNIINNNLELSRNLISKNRLTSELRGPKIGKDELKRRFLVSLWLQYLPYNMERNIYYLYELHFGTLEPLGENRFNDLLYGIAEY